MAKTASVGLSFKVGRCYLGHSLCRSKCKLGHSLPEAPADSPRVLRRWMVERIRESSAYRRLPIMARAMKGDREKCLVAGASDYLARPANTEQLLSSLRIWLHR